METLRTIKGKWTYPKVLALIVMLIASAMANQGIITEDQYGEFKSFAWTIAEQVVLDYLEPKINPQIYTLTRDYDLVVIDVEDYAILFNGTSNKIISWAQNDDGKVLNWALGNLTSGRTWLEQVAFIGNFTVTEKLIPDSYTDIFIRGVLKAQDNLNDAVIETSATRTAIFISGGEIDGNLAGQSTPDVSRGIELRYVTNFEIDDVYIHDTKGESVYIRDSSEGRIDYIAEDAENPFLTVYDSDRISGSVRGTTSTDDHLFYFYGAQYCTLNLDGKTGVASGLYMAGAADHETMGNNIDATIQDVADDAGYMTDYVYDNVVGLIASGMADYGLRIYGDNNTFFKLNLNGTGALQDGVSLEATAQGNDILNGKIRYFQASGKYGIVEVSGADETSAIGNDVRDNDGAISYSGANSIFHDNKGAIELGTYIDTWGGYYYRGVNKTAIFLQVGSYTFVDFIVYRDGSNFNAIDNTGVVQYTSTDAKTTIKNVIDDLGAGGGGSFRTIDPGGNWSISATITFDAADDYIIWYSDWSLQFFAQAGQFNDTHIIAALGDYITLVSLRVHGNMDNQPDHPGDYQGGAGYWNQQRGIYGQGDHLNVIRCWVYNCTQYGLYWGSGNDLLVDGGIYCWNAWNGIEVGSGGYQAKIIGVDAYENSDVQIASYAYHTIIIACTARGQTNSVGSYSTHWGIGAEGYDVLTISACDIYDVDYGLNVGGSATYSPEYFSISDSNLWDIDLTVMQIGYGPGKISGIRYNVTLNGIVIETNAHDIEIEDCQGWGPWGATLIKIDSQDNIRIKDCVFLGGYTYGLYYIGTCKNSSVRNSDFIGDITATPSNHYGITGGTSEDLDNLLIENCYFNINIGIAFSSGDYVDIFSCTFRKNAQAIMTNYAAVSGSFWHGNDWNGCNNDPSIASMTSLMRRDNVENGGTMWTDT